IADFEITEKMLRYFIQRVHQRRWAKPRMVICVPSGVTGVEKRAVQEAAEFAGARKDPFIVEEPMAAAIGAGLPVAEPTGNMVVAVNVTLDKTPPELAADIMEQGIVLTGGGALLHGLDARLSAETGMPIIIAKNPLHSVVMGSGQCLEEFDVLRHVLFSTSGR